MMKAKLFSPSGTIREAVNLARVVITARDGTPVAIFGEDDNTGGIWMLTAGDPQFAETIRATDSGLRPVISTSDLSGKFAQ